MACGNEEDPPQLVTIRQFGDTTEALLAQGCLESNGIECFLADLNIARVDWPLSRGIRLQVAPEDVPEAITLLDEAPSGDADELLSES